MYKGLKNKKFIKSAFGLIKKAVSAKFYITTPEFLRGIIKKTTITVRYITIISLTIIIILSPILYITIKPKSAKAGWWDENWMYRKIIPITYSGSSSLTEYQVLVDGLDTSTPIAAGKMQSDCDDIRFTSYAGKLLDYSIVGATCNTTDTEIWVKTDSIPASNINIYLYYGNPNAVSYQSEQKTFSYESEKTVGYVLGDRFGTLDVISLENNNSITHNSITRTLKENEISTITQSNYGPVTAKKLFNMDDNADGTDAITPVSWAATEFIESTRTSSSGTEEFWAVSPWGSATVRLYAAGTEQTACGSPWTVTSAGADINCAIADATQYRFTSDIPILISREGNATDVWPMYPVGTDYVYGFYSNTVNVAAGPSGADYNYISSSQTIPVDPSDLGANGRTTSGSGSGSYYSSSSQRFHSTNYPIGVTTTGDSDGADGTIYVKRREFGTKFGSALQTDFIAVVSDQAATCSVYNTNGSLLEQKTLTSLNTFVYSLPSSSDFGRDNSSTYTSGAWSMTCDKQVYAVYQESVRGDEKNSWTYPMMRQFTYPTPAVGSLGTEEITPGPVAFWKFDEGYGTTVYNSSGNTSLTGSITGSAWQSEEQCVSGKCLYNNGTSDKKVTISNRLSQGWNSDNDFTLSMWFRCNGEGYSSNPDYTYLAGLFLNGTSAENGTGGFYLRQLSTTCASVQFTVSTTSSHDSLTANLSSGLGKWSHLVAEKSGDTLSVYENGVLKATQTFAGASWYVNPNLSSTIGSVHGRSVKGSIDEVKVYPYARTVSEIKSDYNQGFAALSRDKIQGDALSNGLVGYWKMDEASWSGSAGEVIDYSGNGNNGTRAGNSTTATAKYARGGTFDNSGDYVTVTDSPSLSPTSQVTLAAWVYRNTVSDADGAIGKYYSGVNRRSYLLGMNNTYAKVIISSNGTANTALEGVTSIDTGKWYHIAGTYDGTTLKIYVNGQLENSTPLTGGIYDSSDALRIGDGDQGYWPMNGLIDEARVYNRALSGNEVKQLYNFAPGPVGYWKMDEASWNNNCSTDSTFDSSGSGYNADSCPNSSGPTGGAIGKFGKAGYFDGNDDYTTAGDVLDMGTNDLTISTWVKTTDTLGFIVSKAYDTPYYGLLINNSGKAQMVLDNGSTATTSDSVSAINDNAWHHIEGVWKRSDKIYLYVDGVLVDSDSISADAAIDISNANPLVFGANCNSSYTCGNYFIGNIDDVRIYNYARTPGQVVEDMNAGHPIGGSPLGSQRLYWKFDEGHDLTAYDSGPNANNGTLSCKGTGCTKPAWSNSGKLDKALYFWGTGTTSLSYVTTSTFVNLGTTTADKITLSMWLNPDASQPGSGYLARNGQGADNNYAINLASSPTGGYYPVNLRYYDGAAYRSIVTSGKYVPASTWSYLTVVISQGEWFKVYVDGVFKEQVSWTGSNSVLATTNFNIGGHNGATSQYFNGYIDEVKVYNDELTQDQIKLDMNQGKTQVMGYSSTDSSGNPSNSDDRSYCPPGDTRYTRSTCAPVGHWKMDEGSWNGTSGEVKDVSGNNNNGTATGGPTTATGKVGRAGNFDGSDDWVSIADNNALDITGTITVEAWVNVSNLKDYNVILGKRDASSTSTNYALTSDSTGTVRFYYISDSVLNQYSSTDALLSQDTWVHIAATYDTSTVKIYKNGILQAGSCINGVCNTAMQADGNTLGIGRPGDYAASNFQGKIDDVRIYNYVRTPAEIAWDYNRGGPVGWWKMDECQGTTIYDSSGNGYNGTWTGSGSTQTSVGTCSTAGTAWGNGASGKFNSSLNFDGGDDNVSLGTNTFGDMGDNHSISAWVKTSLGAGTILSEYNSVSGCRDLYLSLYAGGNLLFYGGSDFLQSSGTTVSDGSWHQVAAVSDTSNAYLYIDGKLITSGGDVDWQNSCSLDVEIGREISGHPFSGQIDDVRIYNYSLSLQQIKLIYNEGAAVRFGP